MLKDWNETKRRSLIESIVALTIISIVFGSSLLTFTSITKSGNLSQKLAVHHIIQSIAVETKVRKKYFEEDFVKLNIRFLKTVDIVNGKGLLKLTIKGIDKNGIILEQYNEYLISNEKD